MPGGRWRGHNKNISCCDGDDVVYEEPSRGVKEAPFSELHPLPLECRNDVGMVKAYLKAVWQDTHQHVMRGGYANREGNWQAINTNNATAIQLYTPPPPIADRPEAGAHAALVEVVNDDCLHVAERLAAEGLSPIVMDAASRGHFGGGYWRGARAQEEEICRRTNLPEAVDPRHGIQTRYLYPLAPRNGIYVPRVTLFREGMGTAFAKFVHPVEIGVGIIAAHSHPPVRNGRMEEPFASDTLEMLRTFFRMAQVNRHRSVVAVAIGCGAFANPAAHVAALFAQVVTAEFLCCFDKIVFAVLDDHNARHENNPEGNFIPFARTMHETLGAAVVEAPRSHV